MWGVIGGLLLIWGGSLVIYFYNQIYKAFGPIARFEKNMGDSRGAYVLIGAGMIVVGVMMLFGIWAGSPTDINASYGS